MKLSVSLSAADIALIDRYTAEAGLGSRSATIQYAVRQLQHAGLEQDYIAAFEEWESSGDKDLWEGTVGDGLGDAPR